jgi:hypothetical protein
MAAGGNPLQVELAGSPIAMSRDKFVEPGMVNLSSTGRDA